MSREKISGETLTITHICDGEEVVLGGDDGQVWVATFACPEAARRYVERAKNEIVWGERPVVVPRYVPAGTIKDGRTLLDIPDFLRKHDE